MDGRVDKPRQGLSLLSISISGEISPSADIRDLQSKASQTVTFFIPRQWELPSCS